MTWFTNIVSQKEIANILCKKKRLLVCYLYKCNIISKDTKNYSIKKLTIETSTSRVWLANYTLQPNFCLLKWTYSSCGSETPHYNA